MNRRWCRPDPTRPEPRLPRPRPPGRHHELGIGPRRYGQVRREHAVGDRHYFGIEAPGSADATVVTAQAVVCGLRQTWSATLPAGPVTLEIEMQPPPVGFSEQAWAATGSACSPTAPYSPNWTAETCASFTGRVIGLYTIDGTVTFRSYGYTGCDA